VTQLKNFKGGCHPHDAKGATAAKPVERFPLPDLAVVALSQHIGAPAKAVVEKGEEVKTGQMIGEAAGFVSAPVHSPVTGVVEKIDTVRHPLGMIVPAILIKRTGEDDWAEGCGIEADWKALDQNEIRTRITSAGLVGMGGASFPTAVKLSPPPNKKIDTVILNGVECEPYLTADHRLMLENPEPIIQGLEIIMRVTGAEKGFVGIEANKPDAVQVMKKTVAHLDNIEVAVLRVQYPQGAEKQLIYAVTGREVPAGGLPMDVGCVVQNVGTSKAAADAVIRSIPLIERVLTVTGEGIERPGNFLVRIGTPIKELLAHCGLSKETKRLVLGGPMMGLAQANIDECVVSKGTSGILAVCDDVTGGWEACIRCGRCVRGCPMGLPPSYLSILADAERWEEAEDAGVKNCIECGVCTYVCPAKRPMVEMIKLTKSMLTSIWAKREEENKQKALVAEETKE